MLDEQGRDHGAQAVPEHEDPALARPALLHDEAQPGAVARKLRREVDASARWALAVPEPAALDTDAGKAGARERAEKRRNGMIR